MLRTWRWGLVWSASFVLLGCPLKKPGEAADAGPEASASAVPEAAPGPVASNDGDVTHYPDQTAGNNETLTTHVMVAARTEASTTGGKLVTELKPGTQVQKLADHEGFDLVVFPDPKDATQKLEGWVHAVAFGAVTPVHVDGGATATDGGAAPTVVDAGACKPLDLKKTGAACPAGYAACGVACRLSCSKDADCCISGAVCSGGTCLGKGASPCAH